MLSREKRQIVELKDTVSQLNKTAMEQKTVIDDLQSQIQELKESDQAKEEMIKDLQAKLQLSTEQVEYLKSKLFSASREKMPMQGQMSIFDDAEGEELPEQEEAEVDETEVKSYKRKQRASHKETFFGVPQIEEEHELPEDERICPECGTVLEKVGREFVRDRFEFTPASGVLVKEYVAIYACPECRDHSGELAVDENGEPKTDESGNEYDRKTVFKRAAAPGALIKNSYASSSVAAHVIYQKYGQSVPLYRQEKDWLQIGAAITRSTMASWIITCAKQYFLPVCNYLHEELLKRSFLMADETPLKVIKETEPDGSPRDVQKNSYVWVFRTGKDGLPPIILFRYSQTRSGNNPIEFLKGFSGFLMTDGFPGYGRLKGVIRCCCWAHARRKFWEAIPANKRNDLSIPAVQAVHYIDKVFHIEDELQKRYNPDYGKITEKRQKLEKPVLEALFSWAKKQTYMKGSKFATAIHYLLNHETELMVFLQDGRCSMSNNLSEQEMKNFVIGRKNWLFSFSENGATASAISYGIVETARANGINIEEYLKLILDKRPSENSTKEELMALMPWADEVKEKCCIERPSVKS